jgi:hypothetical protein
MKEKSTSSLHDNNDPIECIITAYDTKSTSQGFLYFTQSIDPPPLAKDLLYKPLCHFRRSSGYPRCYNLYISILTRTSDEPDQPSISQEGATYFLNIPFKPSNDTAESETKLLYMYFSGLPCPLGFKVASLKVTVTPPGGTGDGDEGSKSTTVDYADADEDVPVPTENAKVIMRSKVTHNGK